MGKKTISQLAAAGLVMLFAVGALAAPKAGDELCFDGESELTESESGVIANGGPPPWVKQKMKKKKKPSKAKKKKPSKAKKKAPASKGG